MVLRLFPVRHTRLSLPSVCFHSECCSRRQPLLFRLPQSLLDQGVHGFKVLCLHFAVQLKGVSFLALSLWPSIFVPRLGSTIDIGLAYVYISATMTLGLCVCLPFLPALLKSYIGSHDTSLPSQFRHLQE